MTFLLWADSATSVSPLIGSGTYVQGLVFSRASPATNIDGAGIIQTVASDVARFPNGLGRMLIEGTRANLVVNARTPFTTGWTNMAIASAVPVTGPDGIALSASTVTEDTASSPHSSVAPNTSFTAGLPYVAWAIVRAGSCSTVQIAFGSASHGTTSYANFDLSLGVVGTQGVAVTRASIIPYGSGWFRIEMSAPASTSISALAQVIYMTTSASAPRGSSYAGTSRNMGVFWAGTEQATFASSAIVPLIGAPAITTRARDSLAGLISGLSLPMTGFTLIGRCLISQNAPAGVDQLILQGDSSVDANAFRLFNAAAGAGITMGRVTGSVAVNATTLGNMTAGTSFGWALAVNLTAGTASACIQGGSVQTVAGGPTSGITTLRFGDNVAATAALFGTISAGALPYVAADAALPALATAA